MPTPVNPPRGMRDFLPADKARRDRALALIRSTYRAHGFDEIETPVVEDYARLHSGLGGDNEKLSFSILKRGLKAETLEHAAAAGTPEALADLGLRFDLTVPLARFYASHRAELPPVFRSIQIAPVWRAERPQKGRYRQFVQADIDIIGEPGPIAELELITATAAALDALGLAGCVIRLNDRRILTGLLERCGFAPETHDRALIIIDKLDKIGATGVTEELRALDPVAAEAMGEMLADAAPVLAEGGIALNEDAMLALMPRIAGSDGLEHLLALGGALEGALPSGIAVRFDPTLVRGMGYYTGTIFEISHPESGSSVGGGGRYDGMIGRFLGQDVPAVGFSIGFERIVDLARIDDATGQESIVLVADQAATPADVLSIKRGFIEQGHRVRVERRQKNQRALLDRVAAEGFTSFAQVPPGVREISAIELRPLA